MAQCEAEGRKHPTMDLYVGIFNSKLYSSNRGNGHVGGGHVDKWSRHGYNGSSTVHAEGFREDAPTDGISFHSRSFRDGNSMSGVFSDFDLSYGFNGKKNSQTDVGCRINEKKTPQTDVGCGINEKKSTQMDVVNVVNEKKNPQIVVTDEINTKKNPQLDVGDGISEKIYPQFDVGHGITEKKNPKINAGFGIIEKKIPQHSSHYVLPKSPQNGLENALQRNPNMSNKAAHVVGAPDELSNNTYSNKESNLHSNGNAMKKSGEFFMIDGPIHSNGANYACIENASMTAARRSTSSSSSEIARWETRFDYTAVPNGAVSTFDEISGELKAVNSSGNHLALSVKSGEINSGLGIEHSNSSRHQKPEQLNWGARSDYPSESRSNTSNEINMAPNGGLLAHKSGEMNVGLPNGGHRSDAFSASRTRKSGEISANGGVKTRSSGEQDANGRGNTNGHAWKDSPNRGHPFVANLRVGGPGSLDSSSSHGGSSNGGSPTAADATKDGSRVSSFGNILISKGSPHSVSSRSMGNIMGSGNVGNAMLPLNKASSYETPAAQFRSGTSSGRKSGEMVPNRKSGEMVPNRKSAEIVPNNSGHLRGSATHRTGIDGMSNSGPTVTNVGNLGRGNHLNNGIGNLSSGNGTPSNNGNLLVGGANGNVLSYGGGIKPNGKQGDSINSAHSVDCILMRRAQAISDPEEIKNAGNEYYKRGHFAEALIFYDRAVALCPSNAAYRSNRAAALSGLGRLGEAVQECEEAIRLDSCYARAHQRVASLYLRLGLMESANRHIQAAGQQIDLVDLQRLQNIEKHISRCLEARKVGDWHNVVRESDAAVVAGADSAPQIFGYKSEALLRLHKPDDADGVCTAAQRLECSLIKLGVLPADPFLLIIRAQVDMALGRFEGAIGAAESAARIDPSNVDATALLRKARAVGQTRATGNDMFKAGRFFEALALYAEGLESDPTNAVLLSNRAACRSKLGQWEKAVEDCDAALRVQPNYTKVLMRRANCWTKLERWEEALRDYEVLRREMPGDIEVARGFFDVQVAIKKSRGEETYKMKFGGDVEEVSNNEQFQEAVSSPGLSVVQFITRWSDRCRQLSPFVDDLCKRHPCVNFVKVDVEDNPYLAKIESVSFIPTFKIYKNGQKVKEILGPSEQSLEYAVKQYSM